MASSEKIKEAILQEWKDLDFKRKSDLLPEILPKLEKVHSLPGASVPCLKEENKLIVEEFQSKKSLEKLLSRFEHKKQLLLMHEIYSLPVSLRREK